MLEQAGFRLGGLDYFSGYFQLFGISFKELSAPEMILPIWAEVTGERNAATELL